MDRIIVIGGKGTAVVIAEQIWDTQISKGTVEFLGFAFDDEDFYPEIAGFPILCKTWEALKKYEKYDDVKFIFAMYRPDLMKERILLRDGYGIPLNRWATFVQHRAYVARSVKMGHGNVVLANSVINSEAVLGNFNTIQSNVLLGHNTIVGDSNTFAAHCAIGSNSSIGTGNFFGLNTSLNNYVSVGDFAFCGMASNVVKGVSDGAMVYGNPAREVEKKIKPL